MLAYSKRAPLRDNDKLFKVGYVIIFEKAFDIPGEHVEVEDSRI
jgi:hypothetical protein